MTSASNAPPVGSGLTVLTAERVRELRAIYSGTDHDVSRSVVALCDYWLAAQGREEWRPIETAPRDATRIIVYRKNWGEDFVIGYWAHEWDEWKPVCGGSFLYPTHWRPLPAPPLPGCNRLVFGEDEV